MLPTNPVWPRVKLAIAICQIVVAFPYRHPIHVNIPNILRVCLFPARLDDLGLTPALTLTCPELGCWREYDKEVKNMEPVRQFRYQSCYDFFHFFFTSQDSQNYFLAMIHLIGHHCEDLVKSEVLQCLDIQLIGPWQTFCRQTFQLDSLN